MSNLYDELALGELHGDNIRKRWPADNGFINHLKKRGLDTVPTKDMSKMLRGPTGSKIKFNMMYGNLTDAQPLSVFSPHAMGQRKSLGNTTLFNSQTIHHSNYTNHAFKKSFLVDADKAWKNLTLCEVEEYLGRHLPLFATRRNNAYLVARNGEDLLPKRLPPYTGQGDSRSSSVLNIFQLNNYLRRNYGLYETPMDFLEHWSYQGVLHEVAKGKRRIGQYTTSSCVHVVFKGATHMADIFTGANHNVVLAHGARLWIIITQQSYHDNVSSKQRKFIQLHPFATHDNGEKAVEDYKRKHNGKYAFQIGRVNAHNAKVTRNIKHANILESMLYDSELGTTILLDRCKQLPLLRVCLQ
jgi:hypothetical protein